MYRVSQKVYTHQRRFISQYINTYWTHFIMIWIDQYLSFLKNFISCKLDIPKWKYSLFFQIYSSHNEICSICIYILREKSHLVGINFFGTPCSIMFCSFALWIHVTEKNHPQHLCIKKSIKLNTRKSAAVRLIWQTQNLVLIDWNKKVLNWKVQLDNSKYDYNKFPILR